MTMQCDMPVTPKTESMQIKAEPKYEGKPENDAELDGVQVKAGPKNDGEPDNDAGLDAYAMAALQAMGKRNVKMKAEQAVKRKAAQAAKQADKAAGKTADKAATQAVKVEIESVPKAKILKAMPKTASTGNPSPVHYGGGVIYTVQHQHKFRCLRVRGDRYSEKAVTWGHSKTKTNAWTECIDAIEWHNTKEK